MTFDEQVKAAVTAADFGQPSARKSGRNPEFPYVPVVLHDVPGERVASSQVLGYAYRTRGEAVIRAEKHIAQGRRDLADKLAQPRFRALREYYGLPREIEQ